MGTEQEHADESGDRSRSPGSNRPSRHGPMQELGRYTGLGLQLAVVLAVFALGGHWLDGKLGTSPWLLIVGTLLGSVGGSLSVIRKVPPVKGRRAVDEDSA